MKGKTHAGIGVIVIMFLCDRFALSFNYLGIFAVLLGSIFPDIDHPKSIINKYILPFKNKTTKTILYVCCGLIVGWYYYNISRKPILLCFTIMFILIGISTHRNGLTHSLAGMIAFSFIVSYIGKIYDLKYFTLYFMTGYGMHLICDMITNRGIPIFYPFKKKNVKFPITYKSNSKSASYIENCIVIGGLIYILYRIPHL